MLNDRLEAARPFAKNINAVEQSLNQSLALIGQMLADIPATRAKLSKTIPLETGIAATESLAEAAVSVARSYRQVVEAHAHFAADKDAVGLRTVSFGDVGRCPNLASADSVTGLSVVRAA
ncbi:MAG: hypothetical protein ACKVOJ_01445 [Sphingomonadaceae bacterium]